MLTLSAQNFAVTTGVFKRSFWGSDSWLLSVLPPPLLHAFIHGTSRKQLVRVLPRFFELDSFALKRHLQVDIYETCRHRDLFFDPSTGARRAIPGPVGSGARPAAGVLPGEPPQPDRLRAFGERAAGNFEANQPLFCRGILFPQRNVFSATSPVSVLPQAELHSATRHLLNVPQPHGNGVLLFLLRTPSVLCLTLVDLLVLFKIFDRVLMARLDRNSLGPRWGERLPGIPGLGNTSKYYFWLSRYDFCFTCQTSIIDEKSLAFPPPSGCCALLSDLILASPGR